jgi:hypothetical protein
MEEVAQATSWLESMSNAFDPIREIREKRKAVTWVGEELLSPALRIQEIFIASKQNKIDIRRYQRSVLRYVKFSLAKDDVTALVTDTHVIIGYRSHLEDMVLTEEQAIEQGILPVENTPSTASSRSAAGERASKTWGRDDDASQRSELPERRCEEVSRDPKVGSENYQQEKLPSDAGDDRQNRGSSAGESGDTSDHN